MILQVSNVNVNVGVMDDKLKVGCEVYIGPVVMRWKGSLSRWRERSPGGMVVMRW